MKDLIERQKAIDALDKHLRTTDVPISYPGIISALTEWLNELPSAQPEIEERKAEFAQNVPKEDLISRKAAIDATWEEPSYTDPINVLTEVRDRSKRLTSAQPDTKAQLPGEGTTSDLISRRVAVDALMDFDKKLRKINWYQYPHTEYECRGVDEAIVKIENVPSAQPEIILCKDCRWRKDQSGSTAWLPCRAIVTPSDFYCGRAERRADE